MLYTIWFYSINNKSNNLDKITWWKYFMVHEKYIEFDFIHKQFIVAVS